MQKCQHCQTTLTHDHYSYFFWIGEEVEHINLCTECYYRQWEIDYGADLDALKRICKK